MAKKLSHAELLHRRRAQSRYAQIERDHERKQAAAPSSSDQRDAAKE